MTATIIIIRMHKGIVSYIQYYSTFCWGAKEVVIVEFKVGLGVCSICMYVKSSIQNALNSTTVLTRAS